MCVVVVVVVVVDVMMIVVAVRTSKMLILVANTGIFIVASIAIFASWLATFLLNLRLNVGGYQKILLKHSIRRD